MPEPSAKLVREPPYPTVLKPYGRALVDLARRRPEVVCLTGDLTRQCEVDLFQAEFPDRFIHGGMAEANMMGMAGALARCGSHPVRAHLRRVRHPAAARPDHQRHRLPEPAGADHRLHARRIHPGRPQPPGHRRRRADAGHARDDRGRRRRRGRGPPGRRGRRGRARAGLRPAQARRDPGDLRRRPRAEARPGRGLVPRATTWPCSPAA